MLNRTFWRCDSSICDLLERENYSSKMSHNHRACMQEIFLSYVLDSSDTTCENNYNKTTDKTTIMNYIVHTYYCICKCNYVYTIVCSLKSLHSRVHGGCIVSCLILSQRSISLKIYSSQKQNNDYRLTVHFSKLAQLTN